MQNHLATKNSNRIPCSTDFTRQGSLKIDCSAIAQQIQ